MTKRFTITDAAREEVSQSLGELFALSILVEVDRLRSCRFFSPVGGNQRVALFDDQIEECR